MSKKTAAKNPRREVRRRLERTFDLPRLALKQRVKPTKPKAILAGVVTAGSLYLMGFGVAYYGWNAGTIPLNTFTGITWMIMIPTTILGVLVWQIVKSRVEYPVRQDIRQHMNEVEGSRGMLWRFAPLLGEGVENDKVAKKTIALSRQARTDDVDVEDYVYTVHAVVARAEEGVPTKAAEEVLHDLP